MQRMKTLTDTNERKILTKAHFTTFFGPDTNT